MSVRFRLYLTVLCGVKLLAAAKKPLVTLFVSRLTFHPLPKSFTLFLNLLKVLVSLGFVFEVPGQYVFNL